MSMRTPTYYTRHGYEARDLSYSMPHAVASAVEYVWRYRGKNGVEDLFKASDWLSYWGQKEGTDKTIPLSKEQTLILTYLANDAENAGNMPECRFWTTLRDTGNPWDAQSDLLDLIEEEQ